MSIRVATLILRSVAKDPPLTEKPEMLQMSFLRLVFMGLQEAASFRLFRLRFGHLTETSYFTVVLMAMTA